MPAIAPAEPISRSAWGRPERPGHRGRWPRARAGAPGRPRTTAASRVRPRAAHVRVQLEAREGIVEATQLGRLRGAPAILARTSLRSTMRHTSTPASARISRPRAWKVRTRTEPASCPSSPRAASARSCSSSAARRLKVRAQIVAGSAPAATRQASRATTVVVLPEPAGATQSTGPAGQVAAARWSGASRSSRDRRAAGVTPSMTPLSLVPAATGLRGASRSRRPAYPPLHAAREAPDHGLGTGPGAGVVSRPTRKYSSRDHQPGATGIAVR